MRTRIFQLTLALIGTVWSANSLATTFPMPTQGDIVGQIFSVEAQYGDTLSKIATEYNLGWHEILEANPNVTPENLRSGQSILVPAAFILPKYRDGIVINLAELRLYYFSRDKRHVYTYPVGLGRREWRTPLFETTVTRKTPNPTWHVPPSIHDYVFETTGKELPESIGPGPDNPLGSYAIYVAKSGYLIHGTNQPWSIGRLVGAGCIRMNNEDVEELFHMIQKGEKVRVVHLPYKIGWNQGKLYLQAHVPVNIDDPISHLNVVSVDAALRESAKSSNYNIDWDRVNRAVSHQMGIPISIGTREQG